MKKEQNDFPKSQMSTLAFLRGAFCRHLEQSGCNLYVRDYRCICDGVRDGLIPVKELKNR